MIYRLKYCLNNKESKIGFLNMRGSFILFPPGITITFAHIVSFFKNFDHDIIKLSIVSFSHISELVSVCHNTMKILKLKNEETKIIVKVNNILLHEQVKGCEKMTRTVAQGTLSDPKGKRTLLKKQIWKSRELYLFLLPAFAFMILFKYVPMYGVLMAFQDVKIGDTFAMSEFIGLAHFKRFFSSPWLPTILKNTVCLSLLVNVLTWPLAPGLAILLHNSNNVRIKKAVQNITYMPYLLSTVVAVSIVNVFCGGETGLVNIVLRNLGMDRINFFGNPDWVYPLYTIVNIWMNTGYGAIVFLGALAGIDEEMIEAARVDGASKLRIIWSIQIPTIMPTLVTMLILNMGHMFALGTDLALLLQTDLNLTMSEIIGTYVYKTGISGGQYGFAAAVGLFQNFISLAMILIVNFVAKKTTDTSVI